MSFPGRGLADRGLSKAREWCAVTCFSFNTETTS